ncbi:MAG: TonB-dependent receptor [Bryobacterales bacterium]|nr:TonB-dependent receptor [Bryobacterales bacterium]
MLLLVFVLSAVLQAQVAAPTGSVRGVIVDGTRSPIPGAAVTVVNVDTSLRRSTRTDDDGEFGFPALPIGFYTLSVEAAGFARTRTTAFAVSPGQTSLQRLQLQPANVIEKLEVTAASGSVDLAASTATVALGYERIEEAPARSRNYLNFVLAAPGVAPSAGSVSQRTMTGVRSPLADTGFTFGGLRPRNNSIRIDGMDNRDETTGGNRVAVGLEMVQEFAVSSTSVGAELGGAAGGLLNMVTRSGVNVWHGDVTFFLQNGRMNARRSEIDLPEKPDFRRYQPGVSGMGPLRRDKTFIAAAVEYERESGDELSNVPQGFPEPGVQRRLYPTQSRGTELSSKLDHQMGEKHTASLRYAFSRGRVRNEVQGPDNFADRSAQGSSLTTDHSLVGNWLSVPGPNVVNDVRVQVAERSMSLTPNGSGPLIEIPGVVSFGTHPRLDATRTERHYQVVETIDVARGAHHLNAGADIHGVTLDSALRHRYAGLFVFPTLAAYRLRQPDLYIQAFGDPRTQLNTVPLGLWAQDRWELRGGLSLTYGVRYEHQTLPAALPASSHNVAPRLGLAWRPSVSRPLVIRAGAGLFHDRYPLVWLNEALQKDGQRGYEVYGAGADAVRAFNGLSVALLPSRYSASGLRSTHGRKFTAGFEYEIAAETSLSVEAARIDGFHLPGVRNAALTLPPQYALETAARSSYSGVTVTLNRRLSKEFAALVSYTAARTRDNASDFDEHPANPADLRGSWALSRQHQAHRFSASGLFELPVDDAEFLPQWLREGLEQISVAPIFSTGTGRPINALLTTDPLRTGAYPLVARPAGLGRNPYFGPRQVNLDIRVMKTIPVWENRAKFQFGVESFNLLNHTNVERVSPSFQAGAERLSTYGGILESLPARQVQLMAQLEF